MILIMLYCIHQGSGDQAPTAAKLEVYKLFRPADFYFPREARKFIKGDPYKFIVNSSEEDINTFYRFYRSLKIRTEYAEKKELCDCSIPDRLSLYNFHIDTKSIQSVLEQFYQENKTTKVAIIGHAHGSLCFTDRTDIYDMSVRYFTNVLDWCKKNNKNLYILFNNLYKKLNKLISIPKKDLHFLIVRQLDAVRGRGQHFDKYWKDGSDLYLINVGIDVYYDIFPVLDSRYNSGYRIKIPDGYMVNIKKDVRHIWSHGLPENIPSIEGRFSVQFKTTRDIDFALYSTSLGVSD